MAGRRQHFIPRHFQRAFAADDSNGRQIWLFRRETGRAIKTSINNAAVATDFYEKPNSADIPTLDDLITDYENRLTALVNRIREYEVGHNLPASEIAEVAAHLSIRAAFIRELVAQGAQSLIDLIHSLIQNPESVVGGVKIPMHVAPEYFAKMLIEKLEEEGLLAFTNVSRPVIVRLFYIWLREEYDALRDKVSESFSMLMESLPFQIGGLSRVTHTRVLQDSMAPAQRRDQLAALNWTIECYEAGDAVLPDCVVIAKDANGWGAHILSEKDSLECVILPIGPDRLAVGKVDNTAQLSLADYNNHAVMSCFSFFLASSSNETLQLAIADLGGEVRDKVTRLTEDAGQSVVENALRIDVGKPTGNPESITWDACLETQTFSFSVRLHDFGDDVLVKKVGQSVSDLLRNYSSVLPVRKLDGITFAVDYAAAISDLDRGFEPLSKTESVENCGGVGVVMPLLVRRDDQIKTHVVARADIAMSLVSDDAAALREADAVMLFGLASCALSDLIDSKFPGVLLAPHPDTYDGWLANYTDGIFSVYFTYRVVPTGYDQIELFQKIAQDALEGLVSAAREASAAYKSDSDHEAYFVLCAGAAAKLMYALARLFGARCGVLGPFAEDRILHDRLTALSLRKWASLFDADLNRFHNGLEDWDDPSEIHFLNRHLERLLYEAGVLPDQLEAGNLYVHVSNEARIVELDRTICSGFH